MIKTKIDVDDKWSIVLFVNIDYNEYYKIESALTDILAPTSVIDDIYNKISNEYDSGFTYSNPDYRASVVGINKTTSRAELIDSIIHEVDHVQADICHYYNIPLDSEAAAYLIGYLGKSFYKVCSKLFCNY